MFNDKEFDREIDCLKAHLGIFAYELEKSDNVLEFIKNNEPYRLQINKPDKGYIVDIRISIIAKLEVLQEILGYSYDKIKRDIERAE